MVCGGAYAPRTPFFGKSSPGLSRYLSTLNMKLGLLIYGSLDTLSGGYLYDRKLVQYLRSQEDTVEIISLPWRNYAAHLTDNIHFRLPPDLDLLIQDELNHPSLLSANRRPHAYPILSLVHHLRCSEQRPAWQNWFYRILEKRYLQSVDGFIFNSQTTREVVNMLIKDRKPYIVAYPPTDRFGQGLNESEIEARAKEQGPLRILFLGNVIHRKGLHTLLEALSFEQFAFSLDVVGALDSEPEYAQELRTRSEVSGLQSHVFFQGPLDNENLIDQLKSAHVLVVPSSYEGFGIVYLEGMAFGLPAIGTTAGGATEIISNGETGYLIPPDGAVTLAERLSMLARDRELLARLSLNALHRYNHQPSWGETAGQIREFLFSMIKT
jgi:glycosyltransferase involved in cell wall biosynthesis